MTVDGLGREALEDLGRRGFTRRQMLRVVSLIGAGAAVLPFGGERALAQLSNAGPIPDDAVKINANEFPEGPSELALAALADSRAPGQSLSVSETDALVKTAASLEKLKPEQFAVYPGSSLALHHAVIAFTSPTRALVVAEPGYEAAAAAATFIGAPVIRVPLRADASHDLPAMLARVENAAGRVVLRLQSEQPDRHGDPAQGDRRAREGRAARGRRSARRGVHPSLRRASRHRFRARREERGPAPHLLEDSSAWPVCAPASRSRGRSCSPHDAVGRGRDAVHRDGGGPRRALGETALIAARKRGNTERRTDVMRFFDAHGLSLQRPRSQNHLMVDTRMPTMQVIEGLKRQNVYVGRPWPAWPTHVRVSIGSADDMERFSSSRVVPRGDGGLPSELEEMTSLRRTKKARRGSGVDAPCRRAPACAQCQRLLAGMTA
jgi:hypothetical protein